MRKKYKCCALLDGLSTTSYAANPRVPDASLALTIGSTEGTGSDSAIEPSHSKPIAMTDSVDMALRADSLAANTSSPRAGGHSDQYRRDCSASHGVASIPVISRSCWHAPRKSVAFSQ